MARFAAHMRSGAGNLACLWHRLREGAESDANDTVEFCFSKQRKLSAAKCIIRKALARHGRPVRITIDGRETNRIAMMQCDAEIRLSQAGKPIVIAPANT
ncbi:transposase-like protein [Brucella pseudogrignonensis]|uniref:Transposase-like protein n=1 Tax=Brucella pseudogrignonensis TaxID=419475 RepID=A0ABU1MF65_9HYPH|nr:transposase-like protein [Brucella pseudogrignonensis]